MSGKVVTAPTPDRFPHWIDEHVRFADLDPLGHCNNAAISGFFESARVALLASVGFPLGTRGIAFSVVHQAIAYRHELLLGARLRVGTRVAKLGRTSITLANALYDGERCAATAHIVGVMIGLDTRRPVELPAELRERLAGCA